MHTPTLEAEAPPLAAQMPTRGSGAAPDMAAGIIALGVPLLVAVLMAFASGGYFVTSWAVAALVLIGTLALVVIGGHGGVGGRLGILALGAWLGLAAWQGLSAGWASEPAASQQAMGQSLLYAAAFALGLFGLRRAGWLPWVAVAVLFTTWIPVAIAVAARLFPEAVGGEDDFARLSWPITYWNGLGALAGFGFVLAIGIAGSPRLEGTLRAAAAATAPVFGLCLYFTLSRGAIVAAALAVLALIALAPGRIETIASAVVAIAGTGVVVAMAEREGNLVALGGQLPDHVAEGRRVALVLLLVVAVCGAAGWIAVTGAQRLAGRRRRLAGALIAVLALGTVTGGWVAKGPGGNPVTWADAQFESFRSFSAGTARTDDSVASRLAVAAGSGRWQNWGVAWDEWQSEPIVGTGAGDFRFAWNERREVDLYVVNAHSLYLEVMGESGLIGLLLLITPLGLAVIATGLVAVRRSGHPHCRDIVVAMCAAGVIAVHAAGDWDWQLPAVTLPAMLLGACALKAALQVLAWDRPEGWRLRAPVLVVSAVSAFLVVGLAGSAGLVDRGRAEAREGRLEQALQTARDAQALQGNAPAPRLLEAYVLTDLGRHAEADVAFAAALARSPRDWSVMADWAAALINRGDRAAAVPLLRRAEALNPREQRVQILKGLLTPKAA